MLSKMGAAARRSVSRTVLGPLAVAGALGLSVSAAFAAEITVWCWDPNFNVAIMKEAGERYAKSHPDFKLNVVDFAKVDVEQKLQTGLASGVTDGMPDIVLIEDYGAQKYLQSFPGAFAPMTDKVDYKAFAPYKVELATLDGQTYSMPFDSGVTGLYYRKDYIEAAGYKRRTCRTSPGTSISRSARPCRRRPARRCSATIPTTPASPAS